MSGVKMLINAKIKNNKVSDKNFLLMLFNNFNDKLVLKMTDTSYHENAWYRHRYSVLMQLLYYIILYYIIL